jgi:hypothetical protein
MAGSGKTTFVHVSFNNRLTFTSALDLLYWRTRQKVIQHKFRSSSSWSPLSMQHRHTRLCKVQKRNENLSIGTERCNLNFTQPIRCPIRLSHQSYCAEARLIRVSAALKSNLFLATSLLIPLGKSKHFLSQQAGRLFHKLLHASFQRLIFTLQIQWDAKIQTPLYLTWCTLLASFTRLSFHC